MKTETVRQWELGFAFFFACMLLAVMGLTGLLLFLLKGGATFSLILLGACVAVQCYFALRFLAMWNTVFLLSEEDVKMTRRGKTLKACKWTEIACVYLHASGVAPRQNNIIFAASNIENPFDRQQIIRIKKDPRFLFWMAYTEKKERVLMRYAADKIVKS